MPTVEWDIPFTVETPFGNLLLNQDLGGGREFKVNGESSVARRAIRATSDPIPQGDGETFHDRYANGYEMQFAVQLWQATDQAACDVILAAMRDELYGYLWALLRPVDDGGRINWTPSGQDPRLLDAVRLLELRDPGIGEETGAIEITFILDSPFPYAISLEERETALSGTVTLANDGNVDFYPVFHVHGATSGFTITDNETGFQYVYDASLPGAQAIGAGDYGEIDMFRGGIIYLDGDEDNLKAGVDVLESDILTVQPGGSSYSISGASANVLMHDAWA